MDVVFYYGNIFISYGIIGYVMLKFMFALYKPRYEKKWIYIIIYLFIVIFLIILYQTKMAFVKSVFSFALVFLLSKGFFQSASLKIIIGSSVFFFLYLFIIDSLSVVLVSVAIQNAIEIIKNDQRLLFISGVGNSILLLGSYRFFIEILKKHRMDLIAFQQNIFLLILAFFEILVTIYIMILSQSLANSIIQVIIMICFLGFDFYLIYLFESISKKNRLEQEVALARQQGVMQNNYFATIEAQYDESQRLIHDMKNHLLTLEIMYHQEGSQGEEEVYADILYEKMDQLGSRFKCDNRVLSIIMNDKIRRSEEHGIEFKTDMQNLDLAFISSFDLTTVFSNILDNAIESCEEVNSKQRYIGVKMYRFNDFLILKIENSANEPPLKEKNHFSSTKGQGHFGLGLKNVQRSLDEYEGTIEYEYKESVFCTKIIIPYQD